MRILLAEDSLFNQRLAVGVLERQGHHVVVANNGKEAVAAVQTEPFDLVLMDIQMPEMDGIEATAVIRACEQPTGEHIPIVAMTAHAMKGDRERCLEAGMDGYVPKPIRAQELFEVIHSVLGAAAECPQPETAPAVDWDAALEAAQGNRELLRELIDIFVKECPRLLAQIRQSIGHGDCAALRIAADTLKGSLRHFRAERATESVERIEAIGRAGDLDNTGDAVAALEQETERVLSTLRSIAQAKDLAEET